MKYSVEETLKKLTHEEKLRLLTGVNFFDSYGVERLDIPSFKMSDGPHGVRAQDGDKGDHLGIGASAKATCFPSGAASASTWNEGLLEKMGAAIANEARDYGIRVMLGPAFNLKRSPLCGRSFEYYSEDPLLAGRLAASYIRGMQGEGVAACPKHFAANNQEDRRMVSDSVIDEETLNRLYLRPFELAVKKGNPWSIMCAYNRINGVYCSENAWLLKKVLRERWGFDGAVISDWGAVSNRSRSAAAGMDLEMPGTGPFSYTDLQTGLMEGSVTERDIDACVENILRLIERTDHPSDTPADPDSHHTLAQCIAEESLILLKNDRNLLPLQNHGRIAVIGALAENPRYQGGGSSHVASWQVDSPLEELRRELPNAEIIFQPGYSLENGETPDEDLFAKAESAAEHADRVLLFVGLPEQYETEGSDRKNMKLPPVHDLLAELILKANRNTVVILNTGAPVELPWRERADSILLAYTAGDGLGAALARVLSGKVNPSGKLAETFPEKLEHTPAYLTFHADPDRAIYGEGIFIGYRWYDKVDRRPAFSFGHGLSYTTFDYEKLEIAELTDGFTCSVTVRNNGPVSGGECVQLYVGLDTPQGAAPVKELAGFHKLFLEPGERGTCSFELSREDLSGHVPTGAERTACRIMVGASSADLRLSEVVYIDCREKVGLVRVSASTTLGELADDMRTYPILCRLLENSPMYRPAEMPDAPDFLRNLPLWTVNHMSGRSITPEQLDSWIWQFNKQLHA